MDVCDPGHAYRLAWLDGKPGNNSDLLIFVKREGENYPGNVGQHGGTTTQEVLRALIDRTKYVQVQQHWPHNEFVLKYLRKAIYELEIRAALAARLKGFTFNYNVDIIETYPSCPTCGHIWCNGERHGGPIG